MSLHLKLFHPFSLWSRSFTKIGSSEAKATCVEPWLVVSTILVSAALFSSVAYLFYMKRKLLLARIFKLWSSGEPSPKPKKSSVSISSYPFGDLNRQRTLSFASTPYPHFEPMPTITEEENEVSSDYGGDENQASPDQTSTVHSAPIC
ncbi:hypothetical protein AB6A40_008045 [Gnathostoma spinigerum]|uniref:Uncharacterized protein n=1 Tax=Gnathostoma spinigerum TaxID=75299 RepID=A0ABD6ENG0_9BILA